MPSRIPQSSPARMMDDLAYDQIEAAVMETSRGRWFLDEYARRHRHSDTLAVLDAIKRLQDNLTSRAVAPAQQGDLLDMARAIARTQHELHAMGQNAMKGAGYSSASDALDAVVATTEQATSSILSAAEKVQEQAWTLREKHGDAAAYDLFDACATEIYTACGFQDLTAQRIGKVVELMRFVDQRIRAMLEAAGLGAEIAVEPVQDDAPSRAENPADIWMSEANQAEIDDTFDFFVPAEVAEPTMIGAEFLDFEDDPIADIVVPQPKAKAKRAKAEARPASSAKLAAKKMKAASTDARPAAREAASLASYDSLSTDERLRAFR